MIKFSLLIQAEIAYQFLVMKVICFGIFTFNDIKQDYKDGGRPGNHFNSVHKVGDKVFFLAHNNGRPSEIRELTWPELRVIGVKQSNAFWAHNIWIGERGFVICDSKNGSLYELNSQKTIWRQPGESKLFTRGLCVSDEYIFVGYSQHSERKDRYWNNGGVWVLDRENRKILILFHYPELARFMIFV